MTTPTLQDEVAFISSVNAGGTLAKTAFYSWDMDSPATYSSYWTAARKWGATTAGTSGGTVAYYFDPKSSWTATEKSWFAAGLALWSAEANIKFTEITTASKANITFGRTNDSNSYTYSIFTPVSNACVSGGTVLGTLSNAWVSIDTTGTSFGPVSGLGVNGGFVIENLLHEEGHALGLGHAGPYDGSVNVKTQQYSPYDSLQYSVMSYINPATTSAKYYADNPAKANFGGGGPTTPMTADILAIQRLYGVPATTPLDGGEVFGFNTNITGAIKPFFDFTQNTKPIITIWDKGTGNSLDLSGFTGTASINLNPGTFSSTSGLTGNIAIAQNTKIDRLVCTSGGTTVIGNNDGDTVVGGNGGDKITGGTGNDTLNGGNGNDVISGGAGTNVINGGAGTDTASYSGNYASYKITKNSDGTLTVTQSGLKDTLTAIEVLKFADKSISASTLTVLAAGTLDAPIATDSDTPEAPAGWNEPPAIATDLIATISAPDPLLSPMTLASNIAATPQRLTGLAFQPGTTSRSWHAATA